MHSLLHQAARAFAEAGIPVFPCIPNGKAPATANGFKDASADVAQVDAWWGENPHYNLALSPHDAGWCVVDIDGEVGEQSWRDFLNRHEIAEPDTYIVRTPRGGVHLYFTGELPTSASKLGEKIDTRGVGGYVLVPPSVVDGKPYTVECEDEIAECPAPVREAFVERTAARAASDVRLDTPGAEGRARSLLRSYVQVGHVAVEGAGGDARTYAVACEVLNLGLTADTALQVIADEWNDACVPPWDLDELRVKVENAANYAQNDQGAWAVSPASETFAAALDKLPVSEREKRSRFYLENVDEQDTHPLPTWLIPNLLAEKATALLVGTTGSYKSFLALNIALAVATGREAFGVTPEAGPVVYAAAEGRFSFKKRRQAWEIGHAIEEPIANFYLTAAPRIAFDGEAQEFGDQIAARLGERKPKLIVLDTLAKCMVGLNENDARDAGRFIQFCDSLVEEFGCSVIAIHHKSDKANASDIRGTSAFRAGIDTYLEVIATKRTKAVELWARQHKDADEAETPWTFVGKPLGTSLFFQPTTPDEHRALTTTENPFEPTKIGKALDKLKARGEDCGVTTAVLAEVIYSGPENESADDRQKGISAVARRLGSLSRTKLAAYCSQAAQGIIWWLPSG